MVAPPSSNPFGFQVSDRTKMTSSLFGRAVMPSSSIGSYVNQQLAGINGVQGTGQVGTPDAQAIRSKLTGQRPGSMALDENYPVSVADRSRKVGRDIESSNARVLASLRIAQKRRAARSSGGGGGGAVAAGPAGRVGGTSGPAVGRIQSILKSFPGLRITEIGGNRDYDVAHGVARVPTSYHYDRNNPAVDIAGSTAQLDALYRELVRQGGWRQILWRVPGHYDHIHVA